MTARPRKRPSRDESAPTEAPPAPSANAPHDRGGSNRFRWLVGPAGVGKTYTLLREAEAARRARKRVVEFAFPMTATDVALRLGLPASSSSEDCAGHVRERGLHVYVDGGDAPEAEAFLEALHSRNVGVTATARFPHRLRSSAHPFVLPPLIEPVLPLPVPLPDAPLPEAFQAGSMSLFARAHLRAGGSAIDGASAVPVLKFLREVDGFPAPTLALAEALGARFRGTRSAFTHHAPLGELDLDATRIRADHEVGIAEALARLDAKPLKRISSIAFLDGGDAPSAVDHSLRAAGVLQIRSDGRSVALESVRRVLYPHGAPTEVQRHVVSAVAARFAHAESDSQILRFDARLNGESRSDVERALGWALILGITDEIATLAIVAARMALGAGIPIDALDAVEQAHAKLRQTPRTATPFEVPFRLLRGVSRVFLGHAKAPDVLAFVVKNGNPQLATLASSYSALFEGLVRNTDRGLALASRATRSAPAPVTPAIRGRLLKNEANLMLEAGVEVVLTLEDARACFVASGDRRECAFVDLMLATTHCDHGKLPEARRAAEGALDVFRALGDARTAGRCLHVLGLVAQETGDLPEAESRLEGALERFQTSGDLRSAGQVTVAQGALAIERGAFAEARVRVEAALELLADAGAGEQALAWALSGYLQSLATGPRSGERAFTKARAGVRAASRAARAEAVELLSLAGRPSEIQARQHHRDRGTEREEVRLVWRILQPTTAGIGKAVRIAKDATFAEFPDARRLDLSRRPVMRRLLLALIEAKRQAARSVVTIPALVGFVWPDRSAENAGSAMRLYVAVRRLRAEGFGDLIESAGGGYRFREGAQLVFVEPGA